MKKFIITLMFTMFGTMAFAFTPINLHYDIALEKLKQGNYRFANYEMKHPNIDKNRRTKMLNGQKPFAIVVACSDSRIVPEIIFDQGLGDLFVIRNAGDVLDEHVLESIEYAVHHLGVNLVVILGHQSCSAVGEAMKKNQNTSELITTKCSILPAIEKCKAENCYSYDNVIKTHAKLVAETISEKEFLKQHRKWRNIKVVAAYYNLGTSQVEFLK